MKLLRPKGEYAEAVRCGVRVGDVRQRTCAGGGGRAGRGGGCGRGIVEELCRPMGFDATDKLSVASKFHHPGHGRDFDDVRSKDRTLVRTPQTLTTRAHTDQLHRVLVQTNTAAMASATTATATIVAAAIAALATAAAATASERQELGQDL